MSATWATIGLLSVLTFVIRAAGPVALRRRQVPRSLAAPVAALPTALICGLLVTQTLAGANQTLEVDEKLLGVAAAGIATMLGVPMAFSLLLAAAVTAAARLL